jgi:hypothetical protein
MQELPSSQPFTGFITTLAQGCVSFRDARHRRAGHAMRRVPSTGRRHFRRERGRFSPGKPRGCVEVYMLMCKQLQHCTKRAVRAIFLKWRFTTCKEERVRRHGGRRLFIGSPNENQLRSASEAVTTTLSEKRMRSRGPSPSRTSFLLACLQFLSSAASALFTGVNEAQAHHSYSVFSR